MNGNIGVDCVLRLAAASAPYGSASVTMSTMNARHTRGTADANDTFSLVEDNMLKVVGTGNVGKYSLDDGVLKAQTDETASVNILTEIPNKTVSFEYNAQGLRTKKTVRMLGKVTETEYILHGKLVTELVVRKYDESDPTNITQTDTLHFFYDAQSRPAKVEYNGEMYTYLHNLQGDIVGIVDAGGQTVVQYTYDAWGELVYYSNSYEKLGELNPLRYRAYMFDVEIKLYYLISRYYCAFGHRFISTDLLLGAIGEINRHNAYSYCENSSITLYDPNGHIPSIITPTVLSPEERNGVAIFLHREQMWSNNNEWEVEELFNEYGIEMPSYDVLGFGTDDFGYIHVVFSSPILSKGNAIYSTTIEYTFMNENLSAARRIYRSYISPVLDFFDCIGELKDPIENIELWEQMELARGDTIAQLSNASHAAFGILLDIVVSALKTSVKNHFSRVKIQETKEIIYYFPNGKRSNTSTITGRPRYIY